MKKAIENIETKIKSLENEIDILEQKMMTINMQGKNISKAQLIRLREEDNKNITSKIILLKSLKRLLIISSIIIGTIIIASPLSSFVCLPLLTIFSFSMFGKINRIEMKQLIKLQNKLENQLKIRNITQTEKAEIRNKKIEKTNKIEELKNLKARIQNITNEEPKIIKLRK